MISLPESVRRVVINMQGGLGNQMFQMAFGMALESSSSVKVEYTKIHEPLLRRKVNTPRKLDICQFVNVDHAMIRDFRFIFRRQEFNDVLKMLSNGYSFATILENKSHFSEIDRMNVNVLGFDGYWQDSRYFNHIESEVIELFQRLTSPSSDFLKLQSQISQQESIGMHIRRGDYISNQKALFFHGVCGLEYFKAAVNYIRDTIPSTKLFIFSDDAEWASLNFSASENVVVSNYHSLSAAEELILLSKCSHLILSNSSFSWWAAYLRETNGNERPTIIAPTPWFANKNFPSPCLPHWLQFDIRTGENVL